MEIATPIVRKGTAVTLGSAKPGSSPGKSSAVTAEQLRIMVSEAAYYIAEQRGFAAGHDLEDWLTAEQQVHAAVRAKPLRGKNG